MFEGLTITDELSPLQASQSQPNNRSLVQRGLLGGGRRSGKRHKLLQLGKEISFLGPPLPSSILGIFSPLIT